MNTADLKSILKNIPIESLHYEVDVFEKDFKEILNSEKNKTESDNMKSYNCDDCNVKASSKQCLKAHKTFVHDMNFYKCENCPLKTRTEAALYYHIDMKHNTYWELDDKVTEVVQYKEDRSLTLKNSKYQMKKLIKL